MAKFCTKCGKELKDGKPCDCEKEVKAEKTAKTTATAVAGGFDFNEYLNNYINIVKGIFTKPAKTIKNMATSDNFLLGVIALVINCIVSGIFLYCLCSEAIGTIGSLFGGYGSLFSSSIDVPFMKTVLYGVVFMAGGFATTAVMIYLIAGLILKDTIDIKKAFALVGVCSVFTTVTTVVAIILTYITIKFMFLVLILAGIFYLTYLYQGISDTTSVDKNKLAYVFVPAIAVATFVVVYVLPKVLF